MSWRALYSVSLQEQLSRRGYESTNRSLPKRALTAKLAENILLWALSDQLARVIRTDKCLFPDISVDIGLFYWQSTSVDLNCTCRPSRVYRAFQITLVHLAFWGTHSDTTVTSEGCAILKRYLTENLQILVSKASKAR